MKKGSGGVQNKESSSVQKDEAGILTAAIDPNATGIQTVSARPNSAA